MDLKSDFMYRLEQDQELQRVSALPVTWCVCASLFLFQKRLNISYTKRVGLDFSSNTRQVFKSAGYYTGRVDVGMCCAV